jgi:response regulator RpfG family c-di-GMP phosphodiesterase
MPVPIWRALLVDDDVTELLLMRRAFRDRWPNLRVDAVRTAEQAMESLRAFDYALVVAKHLLPGASGLTVLEEAREIRPNAQRILVSAKPEDTSVLEALTQQLLYAVVQLPVELREFGDVAFRALKRYGLDVGTGDRVGVGEAAGKAGRGEGTPAPELAMVTGAVGIAGAPTPPPPPASLLASTAQPGSRRTTNPGFPAVNVDGDTSSSASSGGLTVVTRFSMVPEPPLGRRPSSPTNPNLPTGLEGSSEAAPPPAEIQAARAAAAPAAAVREAMRLALVTLAETIEAAVGSSWGHGSRVAGLSCALGAELGLPLLELESLEWAALLHDVGEVAVGREVLRQPEALGDSDIAAIYAHATIGWQILRRIPAAHSSLLAVRHHHERFDGRGYPDGLRGEQIPLHGRIIAVADVFDALATDRPYRKALSIDECVRRLEEARGGHLDAELVDVFLKKGVHQLVDWANPPTPGAKPW